MKRYGIIGLGRVGSALAEGLRGRGHEVSWNDGTTSSTTTVEDLANTDVVIECVPENQTSKVDVLGRLRGGSAAVLTTTSSFTIEDLARQSGLGRRLAGFHYLPSYGGSLVEITSAASDPDVRGAAAELADELALPWMEVADKPGRISRRLLVPFLQNALRAEELDIAPAEEIDKVVELGLGHSAGPLRRLREAGLDDHRVAARILLATKEGNR